MRRSRIGEGRRSDLAGLARVMRRVPRMMINRVTKLTPCLLLAAACGTSTPPAPEMPSALSADIGPQGGALHGKTGTAFAGVDLVIPPGALAQKTKISIHPIIDETPLPEARGARRLTVPDRTRRPRSRGPGGAEPPGADRPR